MDNWRTTERELEARNKAGEFTPSEWRNFWWKERADTLKMLHDVEVQKAALEAYIERCSVRIDSEYATLLRTLSDGRQ